MEVAYARNASVNLSRARSAYWVFQPSATYGMRWLRWTRSVRILQLKDLRLYLASPINSHLSRGADAKTSNCTPLPRYLRQ